MKKLLTLALLGTFLTAGLASCHGDDADQPIMTSNSLKSSKMTPIALSTLRGEEINEEEAEQASALLETEVKTIIVKGQVSSETGRIRFCNHSPWSNPSGYGYAVVTLGDNSYYFYYNWETGYNGHLYYSSVLLGTSPRDYMGC